jgi:coenzyme F420-reducing hydrogenase gamma subunit
MQEALIDADTLETGDANVGNGRKPRIAFFDFASCEGCQLQIANLEERVLDLVDRVEIVSFREVMKEHSDDYDVAFVEGSINRPIDEQRLKYIRSKADILIALGTCACTGSVNKMRNQWPVEEVKREVYENAELGENPLFEIFPAKALNEIVSVDFQIRGCPVRKEQVLYYIKRLGKTPLHKNLDLRFGVLSNDMPVDERSTVTFDPKKCTLCRRCSVLCRDMLGIDALGVVEKGHDTLMGTPNNIGLNENGCIRCGQCISCCPVGALRVASAVPSLINDLTQRKKRAVIAVDSVALVSLVERDPFLVENTPQAVEAIISNALRHVGFEEILSYDHYVNESLTYDLNIKLWDKHRLLSWCRGAFNFVHENDIHDIEMDREHTPWELLLKDYSGQDVSLCLLSPCTPLREVGGFSHVISAAELDELFKGLETDLEFIDASGRPYDKPSGMVRHSAGRQRFSPKEGTESWQISPLFDEQLRAIGGKARLIELYPCIEKCLTGGGNYPTVDARVIDGRKDWLAKLWEGRDDRG